MTYLKYSRQLIVLAITFLSSQAVAQQCGQVIIEQNSSEMFNRIVEIDNERVEAISQGEKITLRPGQRVLHLVSIPENVSIQKDAPVRKLLNANSVKHNYVVLSIKPNIQYRLSPGKNKVKVVEQGVSDIVCGNQTGKPELKEYTLEATLLPKPLQERINEVFHKLAATNTDSCNMMQASLLKETGLVLAGEFTKDGFIKVISSQPDSLGFNFGLRSNDLIMYINKVKANKRPYINSVKNINRHNVSPDDRINGFILESIYKKNSELKINRAGKRIKLTGSITSPIVPTSWYHLNNHSGSAIVATPFNKKTDALAYSQLVMQLNKYLSRQFSDYDRIHIFSKAYPLNRMGITGNYIADKGLLVNEVLNASLINNLGLKKGDIITMIGAEKKVSPETLKRYLSNLTLDDSAELVVERKNQQIKLTGAFSTLLSPSYTITIDKQSVNLIIDNIAQFNSNISPAHFRHRRSPVMRPTVD